MLISMLLQLILSLPLLALSHPYDVNQLPIIQHEVANKTPVQIILGVMSRCPDALLCETVLDDVFQQTWPLINVSLSFIAQLNDTGVTCMHGPLECAGNIHELCAMHLAEQQQWWEFLQCLNYDGKDSVGQAGLAEKCANVARIRWDDDENGAQGMKSCVEGNTGADLLKKSVAQSKSLGLQKSCSIMISGKVRCVHDSTWKDCETGHTETEFKEYIQEEYARLNGENLYDN